MVLDHISEETYDHTSLHGVSAALRNFDQNVMTKCYSLSRSKLLSYALLAKKSTIKFPFKRKACQVCRVGYGRSIRYCMAW